MAKEPEKTEDEKPEYAIEYPLSEPLKAYGETVSVLKLRKPTGVDLIEVGNPVTFYPYADPVKIEHDMPKVRAMLARLANIPSSSIERLGPRDLVGLAWAISPFFIPAP
jgi:hypothetical protein